MTYGISKTIATFISAFLMGATALIVFIFTLSTAGIPHTVRFDEVENTYAVWAATMGSGWYYVAKSFLVGLVCGLHSQSGIKDCAESALESGQSHAVIFWSTSEQC